jgi:acyl carrier protein
MEPAAFIKDFVIRRAAPDAPPVDDDVDLFGAGLLDSLGLLELISAIEQRFDVVLDLSDIDFEQISRIGDFAALVGRSARACQVDQA